MLWESSNQLVCGVHKIWGLQRYFVWVPVWWGDYKWKIRLKTNPAPDFSLDTEFLHRHDLTTWSDDKDCNVWCWWLIYVCIYIYMPFSAYAPIKTCLKYISPSSFFPSFSRLRSVTCYTGKTSPRSSMLWLLLIKPLKVWLLSLCMLFFFSLLHF